MQKLLGTFDENLNIITRELSVSAAVDGATLRLSGQREDVEVAKKVFDGLLKLIAANEPIATTPLITFSIPSNPPSRANSMQ